MSEESERAYHREPEAQILNDIACRTGKSFYSLNRIDLADVTVARRVLPVLSDWVEMLDTPILRGSITRVQNSRQQLFVYRNLWRWLESPFEPPIKVTAKDSPQLPLALCTV